MRKLGVKENQVKVWGSTAVTNKIINLQSESNPQSSIISLGKKCLPCRVVIITFFYSSF